MKKIYLIVVSLLILLPLFLTTGSKGGAQQRETIIDINVAVNMNDPLVQSGSGKSFPPQLDGYQWTVGSTTYVFHTTEVGADELGYEDGLDDFHVFVNAGGNDENIYFFLRNKSHYLPYAGLKEYSVGDMKSNLENFIINGGGYIGHCGGASLALVYDHQHQTLMELLKNKNSFFTEDPGVKCHINIDGEPFSSEYLYFDESGIPRFCIFPRTEDPDPTRIGGNSYIYYSGWNVSNMSHHISGTNIKLDIRDQDDPLFRDYLDDTIVMRWVSGTAFTIYDTSKVKRLADYPADTLENNVSVAIHAWSWDSPWVDRINLVLKAFHSVFSRDESLSDLFEIGPRNDYEWTLTTKDIITGMANDPALVTFPYHGGRVVLCGLHPESPVWDGGHIQDVGEVSTLRKGLHQWVDDEGNPLDYYEDMQFNVSAWFIRREVAWASGLVINDNHLPPVYGSSQVVDITPELQENPEFIIDCCVGKEAASTWDDDDISLALYYRYNNSGTWTGWTCYDSITGMPYQFSFNATTVYGDGEYEFYSQLGIPIESGFILESIPPGADAYCIVKQQALCADFNSTPTVAYTNDTITLYDQSLTTQGITIDYYNWTFEAGTPQQGQTVNQTWTDNGIYTVTLTIVNTTLMLNDTVSKEIMILNRPPIANFTLDTEFTKINQPIDLTEYSIDPDGTIVNYTWDFGDGNKSYLQNPTHSYAKGNLYTVTLTVTDNDGDINSKTRPGCILVVDAVVNQSLPGELPLQHEWTTIQNALDNTSYRDIIYVHSGTYNENPVVTKSKILMGENKKDTIINGSVVLQNAHDFELPDGGVDHWVISMQGNQLLLHLNNDTSAGENYTLSTWIQDYSGYGEGFKESGGTYYKTSWTTNSKKGDGAFEFNGINTSINLSSIDALTGENVTVSAWVYWTGGSGGYNPIFTQCDASYHGYYLYIDTATGKPGFWLNDTEAVSSSVLTNGWHQIVGTHNQTTLSIYVDGTLTGMSSKTGKGITTKAYVGCDNITDFFLGTIDEVAVWNRTLTSYEISRIYDYNYGVHLEQFTIQNTDSVGITTCNRSYITDCIIRNHSTGVLMDAVSSVYIYGSLIQDTTSGIIVVDCNPLENETSYIGKTTIDAASSHFILLNDSSYLKIFNMNLTNTSCTGMDIWFDNCTISTIDLDMVESSCNVAPDTPGQPAGQTLGDPGVTYTYSSVANDSNNDQLFYYFDWGDGNTSGWFGPYLSNISVNASHSWTKQGGYYIMVQAKDALYNESNWSESLLFRTEILPPLITSVNNIPDVVGFGGSVTIYANVTDNTTGNWSGIKSVTVNITFPDGSFGNYSMTGKTSEFGIAGYYVFTDTWLVGRYNYTIWAVDNAYNTQYSSGYSFNVSANATISIATLKDSYGAGEYINITDPPTPPEDYYIVDRGLTYDTYYNALTGENVLEIAEGPINYQDTTGVWNPIDTHITTLGIDHDAYRFGYRMGVDQGWYQFYCKPDIIDSLPFSFGITPMDDPAERFVRWKPVGMCYVDPTDDNEPGIIQVVQSSRGVSFDNTVVYGDVFTGVDVRLCAENMFLKEDFIVDDTAKMFLISHPPSSFGMNDQGSYLMFMSRLDHPGLDLYYGSERVTGDMSVTGGEFSLRDTTTGITRCVLPVGTAYRFGDVEQQYPLLYRVLFVDDVEYLLVGMPLNDLLLLDGLVVIDPTIRIMMVYSSASDGYIYKQNIATYTGAWAASTGTMNNLTYFLNVGQRYSSSTYSVYRGYVYFNTSAVPSNACVTSASLSLYMKTDYSLKDFRVVVQNGQPTYPHDPMQAVDYNKSRYSGNGGSKNTSGFVVGYNQINLTNCSWVNPDGVTKLCLRSDREINGTVPTGYEYIQIYTYEYGGLYKPKLSISYRNQSKIKNVGCTNMSGCVSIQVEFWNVSQGVWVVDVDAVNETVLRTIAVSTQLALDTIFNGIVRTSDLTYGNGTYRVYAAFRDPDGNVLVTDDDRLLAAWYEFEVTGI